MGLLERKVDNIREDTISTSVNQPLLGILAVTLTGCTLAIEPWGARWNRLVRTRDLRGNVRGG